MNFHSVISMHFSAVSFLYTKCLNDGFISGPRPSWLEWGWSPANHRPQSGPFDLPETMVRTNSSAAQLLVFFYVFLSSVRQFIVWWCHDDIITMPGSATLNESARDVSFGIHFHWFSLAALCSIFCLLLPVMIVPFDSILSTISMWVHSNAPTSVMKCL